MAGILWNDNIPNPTSQRGVDRYFGEILRGAAGAFHVECTLVSSRQLDTAMRRRVSHRSSRAWLSPLLHDIQVSAWSAVIRPRIVVNPYYGHIRSPASQVYTLFDMIHERFPQYFDPRHPRNARFTAEKRRCLERADLVLAISDSAARDLARIYPDIDSRKVVVTHLGVDPSFLDVDPRPAHGSYFLYVGHRSFYKNFDRLAEAFAIADLPSEIELRVVAPTGSAFSEGERARLRELGIADRTLLVHDVSDAELRSLYAGSIGFVYPSEYEGFGLPILEAFGSGAIVATSDVASMPEVGGPAAFYFDPTDVSSVASTLHHVASLPDEIRQQRVAVGRARAAQFSWERCRQKSYAAIAGLL